MSEPVPQPEKETLTYERYGVAARELAQTIADAGFMPDAIVGIARGGLLLAGSIAYALDIKNVHMVNVEFYTGEGKTLQAPVVLPPYLDKHHLADLRLLVVDDVADSGETLKLVDQLCRDVATEVRTAVLYEKPRSVVRTDFFWRQTDLWINFPWSTDPPIDIKAS
ncbi:MAG: phosphoribosyltransferase [Actinomycetota bacterium]